ncbi:hypothetical protein EYF80_041112 [Liparis tanakae]|uniref:Uncharacterized protein n=1 Tax=Liparis tanakae TaxID=230148 RepID=A0A4Z2G7D2_9TELE|nr:hypothetical protein EYF80_041112 [Liparis tanakae]
MAFTAVRMALMSCVNSPVEPFAWRPISMTNRVRVHTSVSKPDWSDMLVPPGSSWSLLVPPGSPYFLTPTWAAEWTGGERATSSLGKGEAIFVCVCVFVEGRRRRRKDKKKEGRGKEGRVRRKKEGIRRKKEEGKKEGKKEGEEGRRNEKKEKKNNDQEGRRRKKKEEGSRRKKEEEEEARRRKKKEGRKKKEEGNPPAARNSNIAGLAYRNLPPYLHHSSRYIPSFSPPHFFLACFWQMATYSRTSSVEPMATGARWWMLSGWMSRRGSRPVEAKPPACSTMKAMGLPSYSRRSLGGRGGGGGGGGRRNSYPIFTFPWGLFTFPGYKKMPPYISVRWTSATMEPM